MPLLSPDFELYTCCGHTRHDQVPCTRVSAACLQGLIPANLPTMAVIHSVDDLLEVMACLPLLKPIICLHITIVSIRSASLL